MNPERWRPFVPSVLPLLACLLVVAAPRTGVCQCGMTQEVPWLLAAQAGDGRFPATWSSADGGDGGLARRDLRATALSTLAILADGSTLRGGPYKDACKRAVAWLRSQQDARGRLALRTDPDWILDHAMGTYALCEAARLSKYTLLRKHVGPAVGVLVDHLRRFERGIGPELLLWCRISARSAAAFEASWRDDPRAAEEVAWDSGAARLTAEVARLASDAAPDDPRQRAARLLFDAMVTADRDRLARRVEPFVAGGWPAGVEDPLEVCYGTLAVYLSGGEPWRAFEERLKQLVVETQRRDGDLRGSWDPRGAFGRECGRVGTTAVHVLTLTVYYRYCRLGVAE